MAYKNFKERKARRAIEFANKRKFRRIPLNLLIVQEGLCIDSDFELYKMEEEILNNGILSPISVIGPYSDGKYKIIDGARRVKAFRNIAKTCDIPCYVVGDHTVSDRDAMLLALSANKVKRNNDCSLNIQYAKMVYDEGLRDQLDERDMPTVLAKMLGFTRRQADKYLHIIDKGSDAIINMVGNGELGVQDATVIVSCIEDEDQQKQCAELCQTAAYGTKSHILKAIRDGQNPTQTTKNAIRNGRIQREINSAEKALKFLISSDTEQTELTGVLALCNELSKKYS